MALNLSKADREWLEATLKAAEPYNPDDPILAFDADFDDARIRATIAKRFLEQDDREKSHIGIILHEGKHLRIGSEIRSIGFQGLKPHKKERETENELPDRLT